MLVLISSGLSVWTLRGSSLLDLSAVRMSNGLSPASWGKVDLSRRRKSVSWRPRGHCSLCPGSFWYTGGKQGIITQSVTQRSLNKAALIESSFYLLSTESLWICESSKIQILKSRWFFELLLWGRPRFFFTDGTLGNNIAGDQELLDNMWSYEGRRPSGLYLGSRLVGSAAGGRSSSSLSSSPRG